jgi:hypothetical protein
MRREETSNCPAVHIQPARFALVLVVVLTLPASSEARAEGLHIPDPITADLDVVMNTTVSSWRSPQFEVFRWDRFPDILVIDSASYHVQDRMFTRLAYFLEKKGFRGKLLTNAQLAGRHGWNAHDYGPDGLASFYSAALEQRFPLNPEEKALESLALQENILRSDANRVLPGQGGVLAVSRSSSEIERKYLLTHESFHGIFFSSPSYREFVFKLWDSLPENERRFYKGFLDSLGYDSGDRFLAVNEFQAYLMQQPLPYAASYFKRFLARFQGPGGENAVDSDSLTATARELDSYLQAAFGLRAGETIGQ